MLNISVVFSEPGAGLFPLALGAPLLPVVHPIHLATLFGVTPRTTDGGFAWGGSCHYRLSWGVHGVDVHPTGS